MTIRYAKSCPETKKKPKWHCQYTGRIVNNNALHGIKLFYVHSRPCLFLRIKFLTIKSQHHLFVDDVSDHQLSTPPCQFCTYYDSISDAFNLIFSDRLNGLC